MSALSPDELRRYELCLDMLDDEQTLECQEEAEPIAIRKASTSAAYSELLPLLVKIRVAEIEAELQERIG